MTEREQGIPTNIEYWLESRPRVVAPPQGTVLAVSAHPDDIESECAGTLAPGVAISLSVLAANILGDAVRDVSDPRRRSRMSSQFSSRVPAVGVTDVTQRVR